MCRQARVAFALILIGAVPRAFALDNQRFEALRNAPSLAAAQAADPVGLRALQAYAGPTLTGADGPMARAGLDLALLYAEYTDFVGNGRRGGFATSVLGVRVDGERVLIDAITDDDATSVVLPQLQALGATGAGARGRLASGWLPMTALDAASRLVGLRYLRPVYAVTNTGVVTSQGDTALRAAAARASYGVDGSGVTVGVISDSFNCTGGYASDVGTGDLPSNVNVLQDISTCAGQGQDEGRAMLQIVHDLAPGAGLAFHSGFNGTANFAQGILDLASTAGAKVIADDVGILTEPMFQDGPIAQAVDTVVAGGATYFSAAGNQARQSYESTFRPHQDSDGKTRHNFNPGSGNADTFQSISLPAHAVVQIALQWNQPFFSVSGSPGATGDLELALYSAGPNPQLLFTSSMPNIGGDAVDILVFTNNGPTTASAQLAIELKSGTAPTQIKYVWFGSLTLNEWATQSATVFGHANAAGARAVGAADYRATPAFGVSPPVLESYSSRGGTTVLFDTHGAPVVEPRDKPEIVATDGVDTTFFYAGTGDTDGTGYPNFYGTSAAAPHAAAVAALVRDLVPTASPGDVYSALLESAIDMGTPGFDADSGAGLVQADRALAYAAGNASDSTLIGFETTPSGTPLESPFASDLFASSGLVITDSDPATPQTSITALPGNGPTAPLSGPFLLAPSTASGTWVDLQFEPGARSIHFDFATPGGHVTLTGTDATGATIWTGSATGSAQFAAPSGGTWLAGTATLSDAPPLRKLRVQPTTSTDPLAIDNVSFTTTDLDTLAETPIPAGALWAAAAVLSALGMRRSRRRAGVDANGRQARAAGERGDSYASHLGGER
jgi:hypothetical protein